MQPLPPDVIAWFKTVFRECNERLSEKLSNNPNVSEGSLDQTWIDHLSQYASPITLSSSWTVKIETHNLGGMRHWRFWEVALFFSAKEDEFRKVRWRSCSRNASIPRPTQSVKTTSSTTKPVSPGSRTRNYCSMPSPYRRSSIFQSSASMAPWKVNPIR
jgi:hypothetical protein